MLKTIIKKEILEHLISLRFFVLIIICITTIPLSFYVNYLDYQNRISNYNRSLQLNKEEIGNIKLVEIFTGEFSIKGYLPPSPLSLFASGLSGAMPQVFVAKKGGLTFQRSNAGSASNLTVTGKMDFIFIIQIVFSLLTILFTFDAVCGEKERKTLGAALSNSIPRDIYILGKYIGTMVTILLPFLISFIIGLIFLIITGYSFFISEIIMRIFLIILSSIIFISIFTSIGLFISSRVESSKTSIVILLLIWIIAIFIIPRGSNIIAKAFISVDSDDVVQIKKSLLIRNLELEKGKRIYEIEKSLPKTDQSDIRSEKTRKMSEERNKVLNPIRDEYNIKINEGIKKVEEKYFLEKEQQYLISLLLARLSPVTSFNQIVTDLSWTGDHTKQKFNSSAHAYQTVLNQSVFDNIYRDISPDDGSVIMGLNNINKINLKELPTFNYERASLLETLKSITLDIVIMVFFLIFFFVLSYVSFLRYDVR